MQIDAAVFIRRQGVISFYVPGKIFPNKGQDENRQNRISQIYYISNSRVNKLIFPQFQGVIFFRAVQLNPES
jgi:hypothetical protein